MKKIIVSYVDCCLPDYFGGHHKPVLQWPIDGGTTRKDLYSGLLSELAYGVIDWQIEQNGLDYDAIRQAIKDCIYFDDERKDNDILFPDLEKRTEENDLEWCDMCHAFFIVDWDE